jgi:exosortase
MRGPRAWPGCGLHNIQAREARLLAAACLLIAVTAWAHWAIIVDLLAEWRRDENYSAGSLVPLVGLFFVWVERERLGRCILKPCWRAGMVLLLVAQVARGFGLLFLYESAQRYALVLTVAALTLTVAGTQIFYRLRWILVFLFLMVPLPGRVHNQIAGPLQNLATSGSAFLLEVFGVRVGQQGNIVMLNGGTPLAVAEACSGLRMLTAFIIVAAFIAYTVKRPRWEKAIVLASSPLVGVLCNIVRIFLTALLVVHGSTGWPERLFHDFAGLLMMPVAVGLLFGELWVLDQVAAEPTAQPAPAQIVTRSHRTA